MSILLSVLLSLSSHADQTFQSPDGTMTAQVQMEKNNEIYVSLQNKAGQTLAFLNLLSQDAEHGRMLSKASWSKDSRFFALTTESSGGHSPWHFSAYFFSRASETFRSIDDRSGDSVAAADFSIDTHDVLHFSRYNFSRQLPEPALLSLPALDRVH